MENTIHGINFDEYGALCAHLAQGVSEDEVMRILSLDKAMLDETMAWWEVKFAELMTQDMFYANRFGEIFANPKIGRFAQAESLIDMDAIMTFVPTYEHYQDIYQHVVVASTYNINPTEIYAIYGLNVGQLASIAMHYEKQSIVTLDKESDTYHEDFAYHKNLMEDLNEKWTTFYEEKFL